MAIRYVAMLRGINLGARNRVGMKDLKRLVEDLGHSDVATYLQSGNVVLGATGGAAPLEKQLRKHIAADLGVDVDVLVRSAAQMAAIVAGNPFLARGRDAGALHVTFLAGKPAKQRAGDLVRPAGEPAEFELDGREVYLFCPDGYGRTKLNNSYVERKLGVAATTRNWKTVTTLCELAG